VNDPYVGTYLEVGGLESLDRTVAVFAPGPFNGGGTRSDGISMFCSMFDQNGVHPTINTATNGNQVNCNGIVNCPGNCTAQNVYAQSSIGYGQGVFGSIHVAVWTGSKSYPWGGTATANYGPTGSYTVPWVCSGAHQTAGCL